MNKLYQYLGILDRLKIEKMDDAGFDSVLLDNDPKEYRLAASKEKFIHNLITFFPDEKEAIEKYYTDVKRASRQTEFHNLSNNMSEITVKSSLSDYLDQLTDNEKLKYALAGNNFCYGGMKGITSFHMHALVMDSYFDGAYRFIDGSQQLANELRRIILKNGGLVEKNARVTGIQLNEEKKVQSVQTRHKTYSADFCVSTINPQTTLDLLPSEAFKPYYRRKIESYDNTLSCFTLFIEFEENQFPYYNRNFYYVKDGNLWPDENSIQEEWPINYYFATPPHPEQGKYAKDRKSVV